MSKFFSLISISKVGFLGALLILFFSHNGFADQNEERQKEAVQTVLQATYKQLGIEENINNYLKSFIPFEYRKYAEYVAPVAETISKKRLELKWEF